MNTPTSPPPIRIQGHTLVLFAFDIGFQIDLEATERLLRDATRQRVVRSRRPAPVWFDYAPPPLRLSEDCDPITFEGGTTDRGVEMLVYDFGAALLTYRLPLPASLEDLPGLSSRLYEQKTLEADARARVDRLIETIRPAIERARLFDAVEDYIVFAITGWTEGVAPHAIVDGSRHVLARAIEAERTPLAPDQITRTLEGSIAYTPNDLAIIDWNAAVLFDRDPEDVIAVLQHANVELLELRVLDQELDAILDNADHTLARLLRRRVWPGFATSRLLGRYASAQTDAAVMFEGVNNAIKLLGNQYLARLYRMSAARLDLPAWQRSVQRKLEATDSLYQKMSDAASTRRMETLEWVIIILIAASMVLPFMPWYGH
jgi:hypothetical protein